MINLYNHQSEALKVTADKNRVAVKLGRHVDNISKYNSKKRGDVLCHV